MKWIAYYQPMLHKGQENPSMRGFSTEAEAWKYIEDNHICTYCREDVKMKRYGIFNTLRDTGCAAEWMVLPEDKFDKAKTHMDLEEAAGNKIIYKKDSN